MKRSKLRRNVISFRNSKDKASSVVLNLHLLKMLRTARKKSVAIIKMGKNKGCSLCAHSKYAPRVFEAVT